MRWSSQVGQVTSDSNQAEDVLLAMRNLEKCKWWKLSMFLFYEWLSFRGSDHKVSHHFLLHKRSYYWATANKNKCRRRPAGVILWEHVKNAKYAKYVQNMQITNAGGDQPMEYYENMPRRELSSLLVRKKRKKDIIRYLVQCLTKNEKKENKYIWVNCYCWGNSSMVEGRFSKRF